MTDRYLFRLDGSRENDEFFARYLSSDCHATYSGTPLKIGPGWIPDFLEISSGSGGRELEVVLIELEAIRITALESGRKYLPEDPLAIIQAITVYLKTIITQCRATADPRLLELEKLLGWFSTSQRIVVSTAAGLRESSELVEVLPLIHQEATSLPKRDINPSDEPEKFRLAGRRTLSREEANSLLRSIRILDAVITGRDDSGGTFHSWRNIRTKPHFFRIVAQQPSATPELHRLISKSRDKGISLNFDQLFDDLLSVWSQSPEGRYSRTQIATSIEECLPLARSIRSHTPMRDVFLQARKVLEKLPH